MNRNYAPSMGASYPFRKIFRDDCCSCWKKGRKWEQESEKLEEILREIEKSLDEREYYMLLHFVKTAEEFVPICGGMETGWGYLYLAPMKRSVQESGRCVQFRWLRIYRTDRILRKSR